MTAHDQHPDHDPAHDPTAGGTDTSTTADRTDATVIGAPAAAGDGAEPAPERLLVDMVVGAPVDAVWAALRDPEEIRRWFGWDDDGLDHEVRQIFHDQATADDDARRLTWSDGDRIEVAAEGSDARLRVVRHGHTAWDGIHDPVDEGWITFTQQLRFALERHPGQDRRTVLAGGLDLGPDDDALLDRLGLRTLGDEPVGSRYTLTHPDGSTSGGEVFFQTDLQLGLTVEEEDDALLVVARTPPASAPRHGRVMFLLSLFGDLAADDGRRTAAEQRWRRWWGA